MSYLTIRYKADILSGVDSPCAAAIATLFTKQNPEGVSSPQWWPGGLTETNARLHGLSRDLFAIISTASQTVPMAPCIASIEVGQTVHWKIDDNTFYEFES